MLTVGDRVKIKYCPEKTGTVMRIRRAGNKYIYMVKPVDSSEPISCMEGHLELIGEDSANS